VTDDVPIFFRGPDMTPGPELTASLPPVSVVICCRNSASTLADTLDAVARQEYGGWWEVVVVDNGSTDDTAAVARRFESSVPTLRVVPVSNPGYQARALNVGIRESKSDILILLDSDDEVGPDYLLHMAKALERHDFVGAAMDVTRLNPPELVGRRGQIQVDGIDRFCGYLPAVVGAAMGVRREPIERIGGFDENLPTQHDLDISWRLAAAGVEPAFVSDATLHYRYRPSARATFRQEFGYGDGEVVLFRKFRAAGMRRRTVPRALVSWARIVLALPGLSHPGGDVRLATMLGNNLGRLRGSLRYRSFYP
jgi:glycosyltransferase involved in cell wall biosynthesis